MEFLFSGGCRYRCVLFLVSALCFVARPAAAQSCPAEDECTFEKPNIIVLMDYSSSMVQNQFSGGDGGASISRLDAQFDAVRALLSDTSITDNTHIALTRFGHDPDTGTLGTTLPGDVSNPPITDGFAVDVALDDGAGSYYSCNTQALTTALDGLPDPPNGGGNYVGTWTRGALVSTLDLITQTRADHPGDQNRAYEVVLMTDGDWNCPDSFDQADCDGDVGETDENPVAAASALAAAGVRVHVVAFGDATTATTLDQVASAGGSGAALDASSPQELTDALASVLRQIQDSVVIPECVGGLPRIMVLMDASSSMLVGDGSGQDAPGESNWDKARYALAGNPDAPNPGDPGYVQPVFDRQVTVGSSALAVEDVVHIGMIAYNLDTTQELMLQYAPCARDNIEWAMNPYTSCATPGCVDPYTDSDDTLEWTFMNSDTDRNPPFAQTTRSFMPSCNPNGSDRCLGQVYNTFTGEGVAFLRNNITAYQSNPGAFNVGANTTYVNILITDGQTSPGSNDPTTDLSEMNAAGIPTYVIGFGSAAALDEAQLDAYAQAGGTTSAVTVDPGQGGSADALADQIAGIVGSLSLDPCCQLNDCSVEPEPALPLCGNGTVDTGEACDDGSANGALGGTCNAFCTSTAYCGNGQVDGAESCDDGNDVDADACPNDCYIPSAGGGPDGGAPDAGVGGSGGSGGPDGGAAASGGTGGGAGGGAGGAMGGTTFTGGVAPTGGTAGFGASGSGATSSGAITGTGAGTFVPSTGGATGQGAAGGTAGNANAGSVTSGDDGGCGCRVGRHTTPSRTPGPLGLVVLTVLGLTSRRRRDRRAA